MNDLSYQLIKNGLDASAMRQKAISSNIANVNTPGYKAEKVEFESELRKAIGKSGLGMVGTAQNHLGRSAAAAVSPEVVTAEGNSMNENGNDVDIDNEMVSLAANEIYYSALIEQMNIKLGSMSYVINK
jgi:flagellar basal-body rod protein FlgB